LLLGVVATLPVWFWWRRALSHSTEASSLLSGLRLDLLAELSHYDRSPTWGIAVMTAVGVMVMATLAQPAIQGGLLQVLGAEEQGPLLKRFAEGAGRYYVRYLRLLLLAGAGFGLSVAVVWLLLSPLFGLLRSRSWEPAPFLAGLAAGSLFMALAMTWRLSADYARVRVAAGPSQGMLRALISSLSLVVRRPIATAAPFVVFGAALALVLVGYATLRRALPATDWALITVMVAAQQLVMLARSGLRVATLAAEVELVRRMASRGPAGRAGLRQRV
jgi:hypothetical protein